MYPIKRRRPKNGSRQPKEARAKYFIMNRRKRMVPVCVKTFLNVLCVGKHRVQNIGLKYHRDNTMPQERRGGDRKEEQFREKKERVMNFMNTLKCSEPHNCSGHTGRKYLPADLNIRKLYRMYSSEVQDSPEVHVKESFFRNVFNRNYNLGFGTPRVDVCSTCLELAEKLKVCNPEERATLIIEKTVHKLKYEAFYELLRDNDEKILILSFDCQKNQPITKLPAHLPIIAVSFTLITFVLYKAILKLV